MILLLSSRLLWFRLTLDEAVALLPAQCPFCPYIGDVADVADIAEAADVADEAGVAFVDKEPTIKVLWAISGS